MTRCTWVCVPAFVLCTSSAAAWELSAGVSVGGMLTGTIPRLSLSPHASISWRTDGGFLFAARDTPGILPNARTGMGFYNQTAVVFGYG